MKFVNKGCIVSVLRHANRHCDLCDEVEDVVVCIDRSYGEDAIVICLSCFHKISQEVAEATMDTNKY